MPSLLVFFTLFTSTFSEFNILLLHINDVHGHLQQAGQNSELCENDTSTDCYGGFARLKNMTEQKIQEAAADGRSTVYLNGGDTFQGTPFYTFYKWQIMAEFVDMLGLDVMSLGNHDFDDGISGLAPFIGNVSVPVVCSNLNTSLEPAMNISNLTPSYVLNVNGTEVGVIGYLTSEPELISNPGKIQFLDEITSIRAEAQRLLSEGVNVLIALGHSGYTKDQQIALEVTEIDVVVGAHSHSFLYNGSAPDIEVAAGLYPTVITQTSGKKVPVVQAYMHTKYLGYLELDFYDSGNLLSWNGDPILLSGDLPQDTTILEALKPYEDEVYAKVNKVLGNTSVVLDDDDMKCMQRECNIGNLVTDAYVDYVVRHYNSSSGWTVAAVGLVYAGEISASISKNTTFYKNGSLTIADLYAVLYPTATVAIINVTGAVLLEALETSVARYGTAATDDLEEFLQVSGLKVVYDVGQPTGSRVTSVDVLCADCKVPKYEPLVLNKTYGVVLPHTLSGGNEGYTMLVTYDPVLLDDIEYMVVSEYIENQGLIYPAVEQRILITNSSTSSPADVLMASPFIATVYLVCMIT